jgi:cardiolipin synthase
VVEENLTLNTDKVASARAARARAPRGRRVGRIVGRIARAASVLVRALVGQRLVGREDSSWIATIAIGLIGASAVGFFAPRLVAWPIAVILLWLGLASLFRAWQRHEGD